MFLRRQDPNTGANCSIWMGKYVPRRQVLARAAVADAARGAEVPVHPGLVAVCVVRAIVKVEEPIFSRHTKNRPRFSVS